MVGGVTVGSETVVAAGVWGTGTETGGFVVFDFFSLGLYVMVYR